MMRRCGTCGGCQEEPCGKCQSCLNPGPGKWCRSKGPRGPCENPPQKPPRRAPRSRSAGAAAPAESSEEPASSGTPANSGEEAKGDDALETTADSLTERESLVRDVEDALQRNEDGKQALLELCKRVPDGEIILSESRGSRQVDRLQDKLRQWVDAQHEQRTVPEGRTRGANDVNTLVRLLQLRRGAALESVSIPHDDIGEEISKILPTIQKCSPADYRTLAGSSDWNGLKDFFADGASTVLYEGYGPPPLTVALYGSIEALEEPVVDELAGRGIKDATYPCSKCPNCRAFMRDFKKSEGTIKRSAAEAGVAWSRPRNTSKRDGGGFAPTYKCTDIQRKRLSAEEIEIKKCNAICKSVARLCHKHSIDVANALTDEQLRAYAEAAVELNHNNHRGIGNTNADIAKAVAASLRASRRTNWSGSRQGAMRDNDPSVRTPRAGQWNRFVTRPGGAVGYTED